MATRSKISLSPVARPQRTLRMPEERNKDKRYSTAQWRGYSKRLRGTNPVCYLCGRLYQAHELSVDHVIPISMGGSFWDKDNHRSVCQQCHSIKTRKESTGVPMHDWTLNDQGERVPVWTS